MGLRTHPRQAKRLHRPFEDPAALKGTEEGRLALFRRVRDEIGDYRKNLSLLERHATSTR